MSTPLRPQHGGQLRQIAEHFGIPAEDLLDFSANINPAGPPPSVASAIRSSLFDPRTLTSYPDLELKELTAAVATYAGVEPDQIAMANGFAPLLDASIRSLGIRHCLLLVPCFGEYRRTLENNGVRITAFPLSALDDFLYTPEAIVQAVQDHACDAVLLANPQNPSGALADASSIERLVNLAGANNVKLLLDEAFIDYSPACSIIDRIATHNNLFLFRSVTKFFAIPGLRVAYMAANAEAIHSITRLIAPWPVTTLASHAVTAALLDNAYCHASRAANENRRSWLERELTRIGIHFYSAHANFLLLRLPDTIDAGRLWLRMLLEHRIVLRSCTNFEGLPDGHLRIAVRNETDNQRLITALEESLLFMRLAN